MTTIHGINSTKIDFYYTSNLVTNIHVSRLLDEFDSDDDITPQTVLDINITYNNSIISEIEYVYYKDTSISHTISIGLNSTGTKYIVSDDISTKKIEVSISSSKVSGIRSGYASAISYSRYLYLTYSTYYTRVYSSDSDFHNKRKIDNYYYFDDNNKLMYSFNKEGFTKYRKYDNNNKLIYESNIEYTAISANNSNTYLCNLVENGYFDNGTTNYVISNPNNVNITSNIDFPSHLGYYMLNINGINNMYLYQDINISGKSDDIFTFNFWYSYGNYYASSTTLPTLSLDFYDNEDVIYSHPISLKAIFRNRSPFFQSEEIKVVQSYNKIRIKLTLIQHYQCI